MKYILDAEKLNEREEAHKYLKEVFSFPEYYGNNLDALYDCVTEMTIDEIQIVNASKGEFYYFAVLDVFKDAEINIVF